jgi:putative ABC transport system substrate-binding protein
VEVIVVRIAPAVQAAMQATRTIPSVMAHGGHDPVEAGFVSNLARPGGNVTGVSLGFGERFAGKWVGLLKEAAPQVSRAAALWDPTRPAMRAILTETERAAQALRLQVHFLEARDAAEVAQALVAMTRVDADALIGMPSAQLGRELRRSASSRPRVGCRRWSRSGPICAMACSCPMGRACRVCIVAGPTMWIAS